MFVYILIVPFLFYSNGSVSYTLFYTVLFHLTIYLGDLFIQYIESFHANISGSVKPGAQR